MVNIFEYNDYRKYIHSVFDEIKPNGYGAKGKLAQALSVSSSFVSQVFNGTKTFTPDQTHRLCEFLSLNDTESDYLHLLTEFDRAASSSFRKRLAAKTNMQQRAARKLSKRVPRTLELTDEQRAIYYSSWAYTAARNLSALPEINTVENLSDRLNIDPNTVSQILKFLLEHGLCVQSNGKVSYGTAAIHVDSDSAYVNQHHRNWRLQSLQAMEQRDDRNLFFTCPMSLSEETFERIREKLPGIIQNIMKVSAPSPSETVCCLNIDLFKF